MLEPLEIDLFRSTKIAINSDKERLDADFPFAPKEEDMSSNVKNSVLCFIFRVLARVQRKTNFVKHTFISLGYKNYGNPLKY